MNQENRPEYLDTQSQTGKDGAYERARVAGIGQDDGPSPEHGKSSQPGDTGASSRGVPIAMYDHRENHRIHLDKVTDETIEPSLFQVPADFTLMLVFPDE